MVISRFIAVPAFATFSLCLSLALLSIEAEAPRKQTATASLLVDPA